jgi:hypothetical protein
MDECLFYFLKLKIDDLGVQNIRCFLQWMNFLLLLMNAF